MSRPDRGRQPSGRMIAFVDAAVAIALTLLVLPLAELVPEASRGHEAASEIVTSNLVPIGSFLLSFVVIARFWMAHHRLFGYVQIATVPLIQLNLLWVLTIVVLPFPTEMVGAYGNEPFVVRFYVLVLLACSACLSAMTFLVHRGSAPGEGPPADFVRGAFTATSILGVVFVVVLVAPAAGYWTLLLLATDPLVDRVLAARRRRRGVPAE